MKVAIRPIRPAMMSPTPSFVFSSRKKRDVLIESQIRFQPVSPFQLASTNWMDIFELFNASVIRALFTSSLVLRDNRNFRSLI